jgi:hypothetical protein
MRVIRATHNSRLIPHDFTARGANIHNPVYISRVQSA